MNRKGYFIDDEALGIIEICDRWYKNETFSDFHKAYTINGESYSLEKTNFAKTLCSDDANLVETVEINVGKDKATNDIITDILKKNNYLSMLRKQTEECSANGTVGAYVRVDDADIYEDGSFQNGNICIQWCESTQILPLTVINNKIIECAFQSDFTEDLKLYYILVIFYIQNGSYMAETVYFNENGRELEERHQLVQLGNIKPFAICRTAENNNLQMIGYGYPKLWNAIPNLKVIDLTMTMWRRDLAKSDKLILINEKLSKRDDKGNIIPPNKQMKNIFVQVGQEKLPQENSLFQEYNPIVRVDEVEKSLELALSMLSMSFGYGTKRYTFENGRILSATEYAGERQDSMQSINKQREECRKYIEDICRAIAYFYEITHGKALVIEEVTVDFDDTYIENKNEKTQRMRDDALAFEISTLMLWYLMYQYNLSEDEAKKLMEERPLMNDGTEIEE